MGVYDNILATRKLNREALREAQQWRCNRSRGSRKVRSYLLAVESARQYVEVSGAH